MARVLYVSATGASEASNLHYMSRLGSFSFGSFSQLVDHVQDTGARQAGF